MAKWVSGPQAADASRTGRRARAIRIDSFYPPGRRSEKGSPSADEDRLRVGDLEAAAHERPLGRGGGLGDRRHEIAAGRSRPGDPGPDEHPLEAAATERRKHGGAGEERDAVL